MLDEKNFTEIDDYLSGRLDDADKIAFETKINSDPALQAEVDLQKDIIEAFKEKGFEDLVKEQMEELREEEAGAAAKDSGAAKSGRIISMRPQQWAYMAVAAAIAVLFMLWIGINSQPNHDELFASNFTLHEANTDGFTRSADSLPSTDKQYLNLVYYYRDGKYALARKEAEKFLQSAEPKHPHKDDVLLLMGTSYLAEEPALTDKAIEYLSQVSAQNPASKEASNWYLGLAHLKNEEIATSKSYFQQIPETSEWHARAVKLLEWIEAYED